ncbi:PLP-dependent aminotransferase family protein [Chachezhania antarctica]|uniref:aminotransferase-like domain-containing protein n=1 Tax=Chachezhania antarctica TaxID=2340860 RepID=UPI000EB3ACD9|nr:PLP-dependent aminotransferase family protein [Chachezhania antarctica]|tara:strand:+ start:9915 stop:11273 length:1359 start_codon:yes stop_codon:yes gene_type:complete
MSHWPLSKSDIVRPAYRSLAQGIAGAISAGSLRPGQRLPTHRELAFQMDVSVQTVSRAYEELIRAGLVTGEVGRGTFVQIRTHEYDIMPWHTATTRRAATDLAMMTPVELPEMAEAWSAALHRIADRMPGHMLHALSPEQTEGRYADMAATWLARCGLVVSRRHVLVTNGVTPATFTALAAVTNPGDVIATDPFTSHMLLPAAQHLHLGLRAIAGDDRGMIPEALSDAVRESSAPIKAVFLLPAGGGPTARFMDRDRREALAHAADAAGLRIMECDPLGPLPARRPPPVASFVPGSAFYFTSMTKCLSAGLRLGFLVVPDDMVELTVNRHQSVSWMATPIVAEIAADWLETGTADTILAAHRIELSARNRTAQRILPRSSGGLHGLHRWLPLPAGTDEAEFVAGLLDHDIALAPGSSFAVDTRDPAIRISLTRTGRGNLESSLKTIASFLPS